MTSESIQVLHSKFIRQASELLMAWLLQSSCSEDWNVQQRMFNDNGNSYHKQFTGERTLLGLQPYGNEALTDAVINGIYCNSNNYKHSVNISIMHLFYAFIICRHLTIPRNFCESIFSSVVNIKPIQSTHTHEIP